jgi:hypothetical protein
MDFPEADIEPARRCDRWNRVARGDSVIYPALASVVPVLSVDGTGG